VEWFQVYQLTLDYWPACCTWHINCKPTFTKSTNFQRSAITQTLSSKKWRKIIYILPKLHRCHAMSLTLKNHYSIPLYLQVVGWHWSNCIMYNLGQGGQPVRDQEPHFLPCYCKEPHDIHGHTWTSPISSLLIPLLS